MHVKRPDRDSGPSMDRTRTAGESFNPERPVVRTERPEAECRDGGAKDRKGRCADGPRKMQRCAVIGDHQCAAAQEFGRREQ